MKDDYSPLSLPCRYVKNICIFSTVSLAEAFFIIGMICPGLSVVKDSAGISVQAENKLYAANT